MVKALGSAALGLLVFDPCQLFTASFQMTFLCVLFVFFFQAADGIRDVAVTGVQTCALPITGGGRTGAVGVPHRVAPRSSGQRPAAQLVSIQTLGEVHRRMTTRIGAPHVGHKVTRGGEGTLRIGWPSLGCPCTISRRMVASGRAQLAWSKPKWRTFIKPSGKTCWRHLRRNSMTSRWAVRRRALPTLRE